VLLGQVIQELLRSETPVTQAKHTTPPEYCEHWAQLVGQDMQLLLEILAKVPVGQLPTHAFAKERKPGRHEVQRMAVKHVKQLLMQVRQLIPDTYVVLGQVVTHVP
jgi:hypothetical protein